MPQRLIVSDLPMEDTAHTAMHQMTQAIKLTLKERGFRAGRFSVGYVACDDSGAAGHWSAARCVQNARLAARHPHVVGVIGTLDSGCARAALPTLARGGLPLVSPLNTADDLTPRRAGVARLSATDSAQAAAAARYLEGAGARRVAALSDGTPRGDVFRAAFARAAGQIGLRLVQRSSRRRVRRRRARRAYTHDARGGAKACRRRTARAVVRLRAGRAARRHRGPVCGGRATVRRRRPRGAAGRAGARLRAPLRGVDRQVSASVRGVRGAGGAGCCSTLSGVPAAHGQRSRAPVLRTREPQGLIGPFAFDRHGDARPAAITIFRVEGRSAEIVRVVNSGIP